MLRSRQCVSYSVKALVGWQPFRALIGTDDALVDMVHECRGAGLEDGSASHESQCNICMSSPQLILLRDFGAQGPRVPAETVYDANWSTGA